MAKRRPFISTYILSQYFLVSVSVSGSIVNYLLLALVVEAVQDAYHTSDDSPSEEGGDAKNPINVWTYLDLRSYDVDKDINSGGSGGNSNSKTKHTVTLAEDPPHLNFAERDDVSAFYVIFVDLFLMSYASCVVYGAGGFGRMGSLVSYRPFCGMPFTVNHGVLQQCSPYHD